MTFQQAKELLRANPDSFIRHTSWENKNERVQAASGDTVSRTSYCPPNASIGDLDWEWHANPLTNR
jgi:hypothetical protein